MRRKDATHFARAPTIGMDIDHLLFPTQCPACDVTARSTCDVCRKELALWPAGSCLRCGAEHFEDCFCYRLPACLTGVDALWRFQGPLRDLIESAKYDGQTWRFLRLRKELVGSIRARIAGLAHPCAVVPVPPHRKRFRERGYDLAVMLARWAARSTGTAFRPRGLLRAKLGPSQAGLSRARRFEQVEGCFSARVRRFRSVLLVDDVITTGATVAACAKALSVDGVSEIRVVAVARTPRWTDAP